jgi:hypothetical protein
MLHRLGARLSTGDSVADFPRSDAGNRAPAGTRLDGLPTVQRSTLGDNRRRAYRNLNLGWGPSWRPAAATSAATTGRLTDRKSMDGTPTHYPARHSLLGADPAPIVAPAEAPRSIPGRYIRPPAQGRNGQQRPFARRHPAGRGPLAWMRIPVRPTHAVGHQQRHICVERCRVDRLPAKLVR